jgi:hypothetical protein
MVSKRKNKTRNHVSYICFLRESMIKLLLRIKNPMMIINQYSGLKRTLFSISGDDIRVPFGMGVGPGTPQEDEKYYYAEQFPDCYLCIV